MTPLRVISSTCRRVIFRCSAMSSAVTYGSVVIAPPCSSNSTIAFLRRKHEAKSRPEIGRNLAGYLRVTDVGDFDGYRMPSGSNRSKRTMKAPDCQRLFPALSFRELGIVESFVVGADSLKELLQQMSTDKEKWWIKKETATSLILGHHDHQIAELTQVAPFLVRVAKADKDIVCLYCAQEVVQPGQYLCNGRKVRDAGEDFDRFWKPLNRAISLRYRLERSKRAQKQTLSKVSRGEFPPTWDDCLLQDEKLRSQKTDAQMLRQLLSSDNVDYAPDRVLANEGKRITSVSDFVAHFRELLQKGCKAGTLAQTLGYFQSYLTARDEHDRHHFRFPSRPNLRKLANTLRESASEIGNLQFWYDPTSAVISRDIVFRMRKAEEQMKGEPMPAWWEETEAFDALQGHLEVYASILEMWEPPRSDSIRAYGVIAPCVYAEVATGKPHYALVCELMSAYSGKGNGEVFDENQLSKRVRYFLKSFPEAYKLLRSELEEQHKHQPYYPETDYGSLLNALEKSK